MKILYVDTETFWRGGQEQLFGLMAGMKNRGHAVFLAAPPRAPLTDRARHTGIKTYPYVQATEVSFLSFLRLFRLLRAQTFDVVHFNTPRPLLAGGLAARVARSRVVVCSRRVNFPLRSTLSAWKYNFFLDQVITVSNSIRTTLIQAGVQSQLIKVIYEGVDLDWIDQQTGPALSLSREGPLVGTVAHLSPEKGHKALLAAISILSPEYPRVRYVIVGDGKLENDLHRQTTRLGVANQVLFTGFRSDSEALMKQFDIFCLPSLSEGLSSAILAAMASSLPVVATEVGGIPELVEQGQTGFLVPPNQPQLLADALRQLISSPELCRQMGQAGRRRIEKSFTIERKLNATDELYRQLHGKGEIR